MASLHPTHLRHRRDAPLQLRVRRLLGGLHLRRPPVPRRRPVRRDRRVERVHHLPRSPARAPPSPPPRPPRRVGSSRSGPSRASGTRESLEAGRRVRDDPDHRGGRGAPSGPRAQFSSGHVAGRDPGIVGGPWTRCGVRGQVASRVSFTALLKARACRALLVPSSDPLLSLRCTRPLRVRQRASFPDPPPRRTLGN